MKPALDLFTDSGAVFSPCGLYRYRLWRRWGPGPACVWIMLNPSTADEVKNDPTVERCERRARALGYSWVEVVNLFAFRATDPAGMLSHADPVGPDNDRAIAAAVDLAGLVVCAWGTHGAHLDRGRKVLAMLRAWGAAPHHLGLTSRGEPRHPLYVGYDVKPIPLASI